MFLKNIRVEFISLVRKGANKKSVLWKSGEGDPPRSWEIPISKTDEDKRLVYGIVYSPDEIDSQGDHTDAAEIEKAAHEFMKAARVGNVDKDHSFEPEDGAFVAESWLVKASDPVFPEEKEGSWAVAIKVEDDELWSAVKNGDIGGLSMGGIADKLHKEDGSVGAILSMIKRLIKREEKDMDEKKVKEIAVAAVTEAIEKMAKPLTKETVILAVNEAVKEIVKPVNERLEKLEKQTPGSGQGENDLNDDTDHAALAADIVKAFKGEE